MEVDVKIAGKTCTATLIAIESGMAMVLVNGQRRNVPEDRIENARQITTREQRWSSL